MCARQYRKFGWKNGKLVSRMENERKPGKQPGNCMKWNLIQRRLLSQPVMLWKREKNGLDRNHNAGYALIPLKEGGHIWEIQNGKQTGL